MKKQVMTQQIIQIDIKNLICHPSALDAYIFSDEIKKQYSFKLISENITEHILKYNLPVVVSLENGWYGFISGWGWIREIKDQNNKISVILINDKLNSKEIDEIAWSNVLSEQLLSWPHNNCFVHLEKLLMSFPKKLKQGQLNKLKKRSYASVIQELTGLTRAIVRRQIDKTKF